MPFLKLGNIICLRCMFDTIFKMVRFDMLSVRKIDAIIKRVEKTTRKSLQVKNWASKMYVNLPSLYL